MVSNFPIFLALHTTQLCFIFSAISKVAYFIVFIFYPISLLSGLFVLMLLGQVMPLIAVTTPVSVPSYATLLSFNKAKGKQSLPSLVLKPNIKHQLTVFRSFFCFIGYWRIWGSSNRMPKLILVTIRVLFNLFTSMSFTSVLSTLKMTIIFYANILFKVLFNFFPLPQLIR